MGGVGSVVWMKLGLWLDGVGSVVWSCPNTSLLMQFEYFGQALKVRKFFFQAPNFGLFKNESFDVRFVLKKSGNESFCSINCYRCGSRL